MVPAYSPMRYWHSQNEGDGGSESAAGFYPFKDRCITYNNRKAVGSPLIENDGSDTIDFEDF